MSHPLFQKAEKLSDVKDRVEQILSYCRQHNSPLGYFAALYCKVAHAIEAHVKEQKFDDNDRLAQLDVNFVNYYVHAMNCAFSGEPAPPHWQVAIDLARDKDALVLEHLTVGMNAHINYDLGHAVYDSVPAEDIIGFQPDFLKVNAILFSLLDDVQKDVSTFMVILRWYLSFGQKLDDQAIKVVMRFMRNDAFGFACILALCNEEEKASHEQQRMQEVVELSDKITKQKPWLNELLKLVRFMESDSVKSRIDDLLD